MTTNARWFASPNQECTTSNSTYEVKCKVTFTDGDTKSAKTHLIVQVPWQEAGRTSCGITGSAEVSYDFSRGVYFVSGHSLTRPVETEVYVDSTSQFYQKAVAHEGKHRQQYETGMMSDTFLISDLWNRIKDLTGATTAELRTKVNAQFDDFLEAELSISAARKRASEQEAYGVSDAIDPKYLMQWNCNKNLYP